jgi:hypothetical protein
VFRITGRSTRDDFARWLEPYLGQRLVAKPTHSSGKVLFLDKPLDERALDAFFAFSRRSYFRVARETQYAGLEKAILVEENVTPGGEADDYKFFCIGGRALYLQIDIGRYSGHRRAIFALPGFEKLAVISGGHEAPDHVEKPATLSRMIAAAEEISRPFDFVRVDLYSVGEVIYFGECTFSPGAGADHLSDEGWAIEVLQAVKAARRNG